jgi:hypothetical protein
MKSPGPLFDRTTHYRIEVQGQIDVDWLVSFGSLAEMRMEESRQRDAVTVLSVHTDQAGIMGLLRRLHGLGMTILQLQIVSDEANAAGAGEQQR